MCDDTQETIVRIISTPFEATYKHEASMQLHLYFDIFIEYGMYTHRTPY